MKILFNKGIIILSTLVLGFSTAYVGTSKVDAAEESAGSLKESIAFGSQTSPIEVYVFTDWFCPACNKIEPVLSQVLPKIEATSRVFFIDAFIHPESMNFTPYNLSFMIYNKPKYFSLRDGLIKLAGTTETPTEAQVKEAIKPYEVELKEVNYKDIAIAIKIFKSLKKQFNITATPIVVIINTETKKGKKLQGTGEITESKILETVESLSKP